MSRHQGTYLGISACRYPPSPLATCSLLVLAALLPWASASTSGPGFPTLGKHRFHKVSKGLEFMLPVASPEEAEQKLADSLEASIANVGSTARLRLAMSRYLQGGNLSVSFIGGSITAGQGKSDAYPYTEHN
eukprot:gene25391-11055_t